MSTSKIFAALAEAVAHGAGRPWTFIVCLGLVLLWGVSGPYFQFSETWQLLINTGTTIVTFLMVFLIQNTQNRDTEALQLKLDELIRANKHASNRLLDLEDVDEDELERVKAGFKRLAVHNPQAANELRAVLRDEGQTND
jgi:low affinity Fe/Cu permease